jgi:hypothetical protein
MCSVEINVSVITEVCSYQSEAGLHNEDLIALGYSLLIALA